MCCWWMKSDFQRHPDDNTNTSDMGAVSFLKAGTMDVCTEPSVQCPSNSSFVIKEYCKHGLCCVHEYDGEHCSCYPGFEGKRCQFEILSAESKERMDLMLDAVAVTSIIFIVTALIVMILLATFYIRSKLKYRCENCEDAPMKERKAKKRESSTPRPGLSWRETSCKRQISRTLSSSCGALAGPPAPISLTASEMNSPRAGKQAVANGNNNEFEMKHTEHKSSPV